MVDIIGSIKSAWDLAIHPSKAKPMGISDAVKFYYSFAIIPGIVAAIITGIIGGLTAAVIMLAVIFVLEVIELFIGAAIYQLFGKFILRKFKNDYSVTFTATVIATIPAILFYWIAPLTGGLSSIIFGIWGVILLTIALMKLQKVSGVTAVLSWLLPTIILGIIVFLILFAALGALGVFSSAALTTI